MSEPPAEAAAKERIMLFGFGALAAGASIALFWMFRPDEKGTTKVPDALIELFGVSVVALFAAGTALIGAGFAS